MSIRTRAVPAATDATAATNDSFAASAAIATENRGAPRLARQALGYLIVGGLAAVVDIGIFYLLSQRMPGLLMPAVTSFVIAAVVNYSLSSLWVYRKQWRSLRRATLFLLLACVGLCINAGATWWLGSTLLIAPTLAKIGGVATAFVANFLMNTFID